MKTMNTWICRLLTFVFLLNCLPVQTWADTRRSSKRQKTQPTLDEQVTERVLYPYDAWQQEKAELEKVLADKDLPPFERQFAELELQIAQARIDSIDIYDKNSFISAAEVNRIYGKRIEALEEQEKDVEKQEALHTFYTLAQSDTLLAATIYALHKQAAESWKRANQAKASFHSDEAALSIGGLSQQQLQDLNTLPTDAIRAPAVAPAPVTTPFKDMQALLDKWGQNKITLEELVELADPIVTDPSQAPSVGTVAGAAELLFLTFYGFNHAAANALDPQTLENATWLAKRLQYRALHQLYVLKGKDPSHGVATMAYGNLMLVYLQTQEFLKNHPAGQDAATVATFDKKLEQYPLIQDELAGYRSGMWNPGDVGAFLLHSIQAAYKTNPTQGDLAFTLLASNIGYAVRFFLATNNYSSLIDLFVLINKDGKKMHGNNETFVSAAYTALFDTLINYSVSDATQNNVRQLLRCTAAPECTFDTNKKKNAVNMRVQALATASMLRQVAQSGKLQTDDIMRPQTVEAPTLNKALFNDQTFRSAMAAYAVDVYYPMQKWEVSNNNVERYGMSVAEIQKLSNYLANIFETFLPVQEPKATFKKITEGVYEGCTTREIDPKKLASLNNLNRTRQGSVTQATSIHGEPCNKNYSATQYGGFDNVVVTDSNGYLRGMTSLNRYNRERAMQDFAENLVTEIATWYLWGGAFKALGYLWKAARAAALAGRAATKVSNGMRLMRFESKFAQAWKYGTTGWKTEMGIVKVIDNVGRIEVEVARPGYQAVRASISTSELAGHSLKSLKGRVLLRRALQRDIYRNLGSDAARTATRTAETAAKDVASDAAHVTADAEAAVRSESSALTVRAESSIIHIPTNTNNLAHEFSRTLSEAEQAVVRSEQTVVQAVEKELARGNSFEMLNATTADGTVATLIRPVKTPEPLIDLSTGLPEKAVLDIGTGNVFGDLSGQYAGTIVTPFTKNTMAYNIAAGLTDAPFAARVVANQFPILQQMNGLTKFVLGLTAMDYPSYYLYTKPYMKRLATQQEDALKQAGFDTDAADKEPQTLLEQMQGLAPTGDDPTAAFMSGTFLGINQLLNTVLPVSLQQFRQDLLQQVTKFTAKIDEPLAEALGASNGSKISEMLPLPGQLLSFPFILAGDPTPATTTPGSVFQVQNAAHQQQVAKAMQQRNVTLTKQNIEAELAGIETGLPQFLQQNKELLQAVPKASKELKTAYKVYEQALKKAKALVDNDVEQAGNLVQEAAQKFIYTQADVMERCVKAYIPQMMAQDISANLEAYRQNMQFLFTAQDEQRVTDMLTQYYHQREADLIQFFTAAKRAQEKNQDVQALQEQANQAIQKHDLAFVAKRQIFEKELMARVQNYTERNEMLIQFNQQYEQDLADMTPIEYSLHPQLCPFGTELEAIFKEFTTQANNAINTITDTKALQAKLNQLVTTRNAKFNAMKQYWINQDPQYEVIFTRTLGWFHQWQAQEQEAQTPTPQEAPAQ